MKKKVAMRVASLALCVVFTGMMFGAPKSKAVAVETAIGTAAVASYFQATGLTMAASAGSTGALVTTGVADIVGSYAVATGAASSGSAFLSSLAAGVSISPAGALVLTAAAVVAIGALVAWYVGENGLEAEGDTAVAVPGVSDFCSYNGVELPNIDMVWVDGDRFSEALIYSDIKYGGYYLCLFSPHSRLPVTTTAASNPSKPAINLFWSKEFMSYYVDADRWVLSTESLNDGDMSTGLNNSLPIWSNSDIYTNETPRVVWLASSSPVPVGDIQGQLDITCTPGFTQPDAELQPESKKQMVIDLGLTPGITLDEAVIEIPDRIAVGTLVPTYEITSTEIGEGTTPGEGTDSDDLVYVPMLEGIQNAITGLGNTIVDGITDGLSSLFVPSETYLEALPEQITDTFEERTGFLTYPFSLLPDFVDRLSASSSDWILSWPQIVEPFSDSVLFEPGSFNVSYFIRSNGEFSMLYDLYKLLMKVFMSFGFLGLCYNKYRSVVGDNYGGS